MRTSTHDEAVARLADAIETGQRLAVIESEEGLGKSAVLARVIAETKGTGRKFARVVGAIDGPAMFAALATGLGVPVAATSSRSGAWKALGDAARLCRWQKTRVVLVVDDCGSLSLPDDLRDLERLTHLDPHPEARLTVVQAFRLGEEDDEARVRPWRLRIRLMPLIRAETRCYVVEKLASAGRSDAVFTPRALARLHDMTGGVPRGIDRLGSLALMAGALKGLEVVTPDVVEGVGRECSLPSSTFAA